MAHGQFVIPAVGRMQLWRKFGCTGEDYDFLRKADDATIVLVSYADELADLLQAERELQQKSIACDVIKAVKLYPFTDKMIVDLSKYKIILFAEECIANGSLVNIWNMLCSKTDGMGALSIVQCGTRVFRMPVWHRSNRQPVWMQRILYRPCRWP